jgi:hypothetical protein
MSSAQPATKSSSSGPGVVQTRSGGVISPITVAGLVVILAVLVQVATIPSITGPPHAKKPYKDFQSFYPFYKSEHSHESQSPRVHRWQ